MSVKIGYGARAMSFVAKSHEIDVTSAGDGYGVCRVHGVLRGHLRVNRVQLLRTSRSKCECEGDCDIRFSTCRGPAHLTRCLASIATTCDV